MSVIRFEHVTKAFEGVKVLDDLSFSVEPGEILAIVGPSGTGKSVTLKHIVGLLHPDSGTVDTTSNRIGYLFQSGALLAWLNVWDNVALPLRETTRLSEDAITEKVDAALAAVGLTDAAEKYPNEISGGMQKRAGLARSIVLEADIILYDEPTSGLDPVTAKAIDHIIVELNKQKKITSIVVTHDVASALNMADRILLLADGKAVFCGTSAAFRTATEPHVRTFVEALKGKES